MELDPQSIDRIWHALQRTASRGDVADNRMTVAGGHVPMPTASVAPASAGAALSNRQLNTGAVTAKTTVGANLAPNCGWTADSIIGVTGKAGSALAYGNAALDAATVSGNGVPVAWVSNAQVNRGPVSATVIPQ
ncbi:hypothetical protein [Bosea sp. MMO-172]|uniref:hypothetical protein n=1 Tax=Bosea sp. MMO-172 TaxID=3127885 RepID=UPI0030159530